VVQTIAMGTSGWPLEPAMLTRRFARWAARAFGTLPTDGGYGPGVEIDNDGLTLHVAEDGPRQGRPVVFLHGITSSGGTWNWLVPLLSDRHRVLRLDFRGHGRSGRAEPPYDYAGYVSDAVAVCEQAAAQPAVVIGHSLGGGAAAVLAQQRPDLVRAVVLEDPALAGSTEIEDNSLLEGFTLMRDLIPEVQESGMPVDDLVAAIAAVSSGASGRSLGDDLCADALRAMAEGLLALDVSVLDVVLDGTLLPPFEPSQPLPVPGVVLAADPASPDAVTRPRHLEILARTSPHLQTWPVPGATHQIHSSIATRDIFTAAVRGLLAGLPMSV
jgi:pimeloyl-ACP methyl ester carboxylesterase